MNSTKYNDLLEGLKPYSAKGRSESASFLAWYFANFYRLEDATAIDCICDQPGDKGVDGIYLNLGDGTIDIFQAKLSQKSNSSIGDSSLKEFAGTLSQFESKEKLKELAKNSKGRELARLIEELDLIGNYDSYKVRGIFLSNIDIDANGEAFLKGRDDLFFVGSKELVANYVSDQKGVVTGKTAKFDVSGFSITNYVVDASSKALIAPVSALELANLPGIQDQSLFAYNVRAYLGRSQVNRDIQTSIRDKALHKMFPLFHNGITVIAKKVESDDVSISVEDFFVINGCQSLNAIYHNKPSLTVDLRLLTKFIELGENTDLIETITSYSNNQNGVKARDFKSNDRIQVRIQNEFAKNYSADYAYEIKRGEPVANKLIAIENETAGIQLIAFDLKEPWTTHRKYQVFDERYAQVFGRPEVNSDRIVLCSVLMQLIEARLNSLSNQLIAKYALTRFAILFFLRRILEVDSVGKDIISSPENFVRDKETRIKFSKVMGQVLDTMLIDLNAETEDLEEDFDYRGKMRDKEFISKLGAELLASYLKDIKRGKAQTLTAEWEAETKKA